MAATHHNEHTDPADPEQDIHVTPVEARQGSTMRWPLRILILSTIAAGIGLALFLVPSGGV